MIQSPSLRTDMEKMTSDPARPARSTAAAAEVLDARRGCLTRHNRVLAREGAVHLIDNILSSTAGSYVIQQRGEATTANLDATRRGAEALESAITRPVEPVLVVTEPTFDGARYERGVTVVHADGFAAWLDSLPQTLDRAEMVLRDARIEKATRDDRRRRLPEWEVEQRLGPNGVSDTRREAVPGAAGPRDWALYDAPRRRTGDRSASTPRRRRRPRRATRWALMTRGQRAAVVFFATVAIAVVAIGYL